MMTREAVKTTKATDAEISKAEQVSSRMRYVSQNHATIRILASKLIYAPTAEALDGVKQSLYMYEIEVGRVSKGVKDDPYFAALPDRTTAMSARLIVYDNFAKRASPTSADKIITLKAKKKPLFAFLTSSSGGNLVIIGVAVFAGVVLILLLISAFRGGGRRRGGSATPP